MLGNLFGKKQKEETVSQEEQASSSQAAKKKGLIGGIKDKAVDKLIERQMKHLPPQQRELLMNAMKKNPDFFEMIAQKIKEEEKKNGGNQMAAAMKVMRQHQGEMTRIMMQSQQK